MRRGIIASSFGSAFGSGGGGGTPGLVGDNGSGGAGNWPTSGDRAMLAPFTLLHTATLVQFGMRTTPANAAGETFKGLLYAADGSGGGAGTLLFATASSAATPAGAQLIYIPASGVITPQDVWIGYVANGTAGGSGGETDSGGTGSNVRMYNGILSFASPDDPAPTWPGSPGPYSNIPSVWFEYTY